jgi:uncharacterized phage protein (TIGR02218 family)
MRVLPDAMNAAIESGAAGLCTVWMVSRGDGARLGFTDHDEPLVIESVACSAASGWTLGAAHSELGTGAGLAAASGALDSAALTDGDILKGLYDDAALEVWRVLWTDPSQKVLLWRGRITRLVRQGQGFTAEIEGPLGALARVAGRTYSRTCDTALGDGRCRALVSGAAFNGAGAVTGVSQDRRLAVSGLDAFASGWFASGLIAWTSGANAGLTARIAAHQTGAAGVVLVLANTPVEPAASGDAFTVIAGCDKTYATCAAKFANDTNFQGFPDIPGDDFLTAVPTDGALNDGSSLGTRTSS